MANLSLGTKVEILGSENVLARFPDYVGEVGVVEIAALHPSTWLTVKVLKDQKSVKLQPTALKVVAQQDPLRSLGSKPISDSSKSSITTCGQTSTSTPSYPTTYVSSGLAGLVKGALVKILGTENVLQRVPYLVGQIGSVKEVPVHPATWFKVSFPDGKVATFRPSALEPVGGAPKAIKTVTAVVRPPRPSTQPTPLLPRRPVPVSTTTMTTSTQNIPVDMNCDLWTDKVVRIRIGRLTGQVGKVRSAGNGWVQIETPLGEVAKRSHELEIVGGPGFIPGNNTTGVNVSSVRFNDEEDSRRSRSGRAIRTNRYGLESLTSSTLFDRDEQGNNSNINDDDSSGSGSVSNGSRNRRSNSEDLSNADSSSFADRAAPFERRPRAYSEMPNTATAAAAARGGFLAPFRARAVATATRPQKPRLNLTETRQTNIDRFFEKHATAAAAAAGVAVSRPDLRLWQSMLHQQKFNTDTERDLARTFVTTCCNICYTEKWPAAKYCWNEVCPASPIYWELPGATKVPPQTILEARRLLDEGGGAYLAPCGGVYLTPCDRDRLSRVSEFIASRPKIVLGRDRFEYMDISAAPGGLLSVGTPLMEHHAGNGNGTGDDNEPTSYDYEINMEDAFEPRKPPRDPSFTPSSIFQSYESTYTPITGGGTLIRSDSNTSIESNGNGNSYYGPSREFLIARKKKFGDTGIASTSLDGNNLTVTTTANAYVTDTANLYDSFNVSRKRFRSDSECLTDCDEALSPELVALGASAQYLPPALTLPAPAVVSAPAYAAPPAVVVEISSKEQWGAVPVSVNSQSWSPLSLLASSALHDNKNITSNTTNATTTTNDTTTTNVTAAPASATAATAVATAVSSAAGLKVDTTTTNTTSSIGKDGGGPHFFGITVSPQRGEGLQTLSLPKEFSFSLLKDPQEVNPNLNHSLNFAPFTASATTAAAACTVTTAAAVAANKWSASSATAPFTSNGKVSAAVVDPTRLMTTVGPAAAHAPLATFF